MKKFFVIVAALLVGASAFAQESNLDANGNIQYGPYETNGFWDNWFVSVGGGVDFNLDNITNKGVDFTPNAVADINVGKWIDPCFGVRLGWNGWGIHASKPINGVEVANNNLIHTDFLWNISNQFWGYKEDRVYNAIPYVHAGLIYGTMQGGEFEYGAGLLNNFRLGEKVSIFLDLKGVMCRAEQVNGDGKGPALYATAGLSFNLGKSNWTRKATTVGAAAAVLAASEAAANALKSQNEKLANDAAAAAAEGDALAKENQALKDALAKAEDDANAIKVDLAENPICAYFEIGKTTLSTKEQAHLDYQIKTILAGQKDAKLTVVGSADKQTGSKKRNQYLAKKRAEYLANLLTDKYGMSADNFTVVSDGAQEIFSTPELNRVALIKK